MTIEHLIPIKVKRVDGVSHVAWAEGMEFCLPYDILERSRLIEYVDSERNLTVPADIAPIELEEVEALRLAAAFTEKKPLSSSLPFSYQRIPAKLRTIFGSFVGQWRKRTRHQWSVFPRWPLDLSADFLFDLASGQPSPFTHRPTPVLLTHDLESAEGLENLVKLFLDLEESVGARSTNFIVPCAWAIDHVLLQEVKDRGNEIGVHGHDHSNLTAFCDQEEQNNRLKAALSLIDQYSIIGYRSPSLLRTRRLLYNLKEFYIYDTSIPTSGGPFPVPNNGCASARPFWVEDISEVPLSMPRDGTMIFLGYSPQAILDVWIRCAKEISLSGGVVVLLTHCESRFSGNESMLKAYRRFLEFLAVSDQYIWSSPEEVLPAALDIEPSN
jgi:peptidoglycan/xylan/chitin deacetylase (PgdA/CDA1 family)